jgi:hypothetical protein
VDNFFKGTIDEVGFYDFRLSAADVGHLFTSQVRVMTCTSHSAYTSRGTGYDGPAARHPPQSAAQSIADIDSGLDVGAGRRVCGAVSQSTMGWGGEPARAIDGDRTTAWGGGSCSHTADVDGPSWFQVDLGAISTIDRVSIYHRTDCCQVMTSPSPLVT